MAPGEAKNGRGRLIAGVAVLALALGAGGWALRRSQKTNPTLTDTSSGAEPTRRGRLFGPEQKLGDRLAYSSNYNVSLSRAGAIFLSVKLSGKLELACLREDENESVYRAQWDGTVAVVRDAEADPGVSAMLQDGLKDAFFVEYRAGGQIKNLRFKPGTPRLDQTLVRSMFTATQIVAGEPGSTLWQNDEVDENGTYVSQYSRQPSGALSKRKLRYRKSHGEKVRLRIVQSDALFGFDGEGHIATLDDAESVGSSSDLPIPETESALTLHLKLTSATTGQVSPDWLRELAASEVMPLEEPGTKSSVQAELDGARAGKMSVEQAMIALLEAVKGKKEKEGEAYNALMAHVRLSPALVDTLLDHINQGGPLKTYLISALRDAGSPEAQAALRGLVKAPGLTPEDRLQVVRGLSRVDNPTAETVSTLKSLLNDSALGEQAEYGLGGNVYRLSQTNPELAATTLATLEERLQDGKSNTDKQRALLALGNAGAASSLPAIQAQLSSPIEMIQVAATDALRRIPGASSDVLLAKQLREAALVSVRIAAAEAMRYREPTPAIVTALADATRLDPEVGVRKAALDIAAYFADRSSVLRQAIVSCATADADPAMRARAQNYLQTL